MALDNFIPKLWSAQLLQSLKSNLVFGQEGVVNRDYQGIIAAHGDTVKINSIGQVSVGDYVKNTNMGAPETLTDGQRTLVIDQSKYFNFQVDDIDEAQVNVAVMQGAMQEAAYALKNAADSHISGKMAAAAAQSLNGGAAFVGDKNNMYEAIVDMGVLLDEYDVPEEGRFVILPAFAEGALLKDNRFTSGFANETIKNGVIGKVAGMTVLKSNTVPYDPVSLEYTAIAGHKIATSFAESVNQVEAYRPEQRFADALKGLHLYGTKVVRPEGLVTAKITK